MRIDRIAVPAMTMFLACSLAQAQRPQGEQTPTPNSQMTTPPGQSPQRGGAAQRSQMPQESQPQLSETGRTGQSHAAAPPVEKSSVTHHRARIGGEEIPYTATAATYVIKADDGTPKATFFFVAYTRDGVQDVTRRPVTFIYNGGPGFGFSVHSHGPGAAPRCSRGGRPWHAGAVRCRG